MATFPDDEAAPGLAAPQQRVEDVSGPVDADADDAGHDTRALFVDAALGQDPTELRRIIEALEQDADLTTIRLYVVAGSQGITGWRRAHQASGLSSEWVEVPRFPSVSSRSGIATRMLLDVVGLFRDSRTAVDSVALMTADPNLAYLAQWIRREYGVGVLGVSTREVHEALKKACNFFIKFGDSPADNTSGEPTALPDAAAEDDTQWVESVRRAVAEVSSRRGGTKWVPYNQLGSVLRRNGVNYAADFGSLGDYLERGVGKYFKKHVSRGRTGSPSLHYLALTDSDPPDPPSERDLRGRSQPRRPDGWSPRDEPDRRYRDGRGDRYRDDRGDRYRDGRGDRYRDDRGDRYRDDRGDRYRDDRGDRYWDDRDDRYRDDRDDRDRDDRYRGDRYRDDRGDRYRDDRGDRYRDDRGDRYRDDRGDRYRE